MQVVEGIELDDDTFSKQQREGVLDAANNRENVLATPPLTLSMNIQQDRAGRVQNIDDDDIGFVDGEEDEEGDCGDTYSMDTDNLDGKDQLSSRKNALGYGNNNNRQTTLLDDNSLDDSDLMSSIDNHTELITYEQREQFLISKLKIPEKWINEGKAVLARSLGMVEEETWYLIKAGDHKRAHSLLVDTIAPSAIINGKCRLFSPWSIIELLF